MQTAFQNCHPAVNFLFFISVIVYGMFFFHPVLLGIAFVSSLAYSLYLCGRKTAKMLVCFLLPTLLFVTVLNTLFAHYGVTTLYVLPSGNRITLEALVYGLVTGGMVATVFLWFTCYNRVVTTDKFLYLFGKRLPTAAMLVSMTLRFVPLFTKRLQKIRQAQRGIGNAGEGKLKNAVHSLSILTTWSLENAICTADSMKSRGYGLRGRTSYSRYPKTVRDLVLFAAILLLDAVMLVGALLKQTKAVYNPIFSLPPVTAFSYILFACYAALCFLPLALDISEERKWNRFA